MPLTLTVGFDSKPSGELRVREGRIEAVADTDGARESLEQMGEMYARQMLEYHGYTAEKLTPEAVLRFMAAQLTGRTWGKLDGAEPAAEARRVSQTEIELRNAFRAFVAERLGWEVAPTVEEAVQMARSDLGSSASLTCLHAPPILIADVT